MKIAFKILTLIFMIFTLILFNDVSRPIPDDTTDYHSRFKLEKQGKFNFELYYPGFYKIYFNTLNEEKLISSKISLNINADATDFTLSDSIIEKEGTFELALVYGLGPGKYELEINKLDHSLENKWVNMGISEESAVASKESYFDREFRPIKLKIYYIFLSLTLFFGLTSLIILAIDMTSSKKAK